MTIGRLNLKTRKIALRMDKWMSYLHITEQKQENNEENRRKNTKEFVSLKYVLPIVHIDLLQTTDPVLQMFDTRLIYLC